MNRIKSKFKTLSNRNEGALITYLMAGDPDEQLTVDYIRALVKGGADLIELGVPFSDPVADGPTIQEAEVRALKSGTTLDSVFKIVGLIRENSQIPLVLMSYYNPIFRLGDQKFIKRCKKSGVDGLIIPDLPLEEAGEYTELCKKYSIDTIFLVTPETDQKRFKLIAQSTTGFLYLVARYGTTGAKKRLGKITGAMIERFLSLLGRKVPLAVGFGLSKKEHIQEVMKYGADGAIVGSCIVKKIAAGVRPQDLVEFIHTLKEGTKRMQGDLECS